jgi:transcriptional regulator with XRE-family HTH domain
VSVLYNPKIDTCANRLAAALNIKGVKQSELCKQAKVPKSSLSLYLSGAYEPKQERIYSMALALNVSEAWLMGYDVPMERESKSDPILSEAEQLLLDLFRQIPEEKQQLFLQMGRLYADSLKKD